MNTITVHLLDGRTLDLTGLSVEDAIRRLHEAGVNLDEIAKTVHRIDDLPALAAPPDVGRDPSTLAPRDGHRPATEETWYCPNCGKPATAFVSFCRTVACGACRWTFDISLNKPFDQLGTDPYGAAKAHAEALEWPPRTDR